MKILLVNAALRPDSMFFFPPMGLGYIATAIHNKGYEFDLFDIDVSRPSPEEIEKFFNGNKYDVVFMGCIVTGYQIVKKLIEPIKLNSPETTVVVGNTVASSIPEHLLKYSDADIAVVGEGDETVIELLGLLESGQSLDGCKGIVYKCGDEIIRTSARPPIKSLDDVPFINWNLFDIEKYIDNSKMAAEDSIPLDKKDVRLLPICSARGCVHKCTFCYHSFKDVPYRRRSNENLIAEIESRMDEYGINVFYMQDDLTFFSKKNIAEFVAMVNDKNLRFYWRGTCCANLLDKDVDVELAKSMKKAGCVSMGFSLESADVAILKAMNKHHKPEEFVRQAGIFHEAGIVPLTSLVVGYPQETEHSIRKTIDYCIEARVYPSIGFLLPQPGSKMFDYAVENGFIGDLEEYYMMLGDRQDLRLNMTEMSDDKLEQVVKQEMQRCNEVLGMGLDPDRLIKTGKYQKPKI